MVTSEKVEFHCMALLKPVMLCVFFFGKSNWFLWACFWLEKSDIMDSSSSEVTMENTNWNERIFDCLIPLLWRQGRKERDRRGIGDFYRSEEVAWAERGSECLNSKHEYCNPRLITVMKFFLASKMFTYFFSFVKFEINR